jgi:cytidylate kinase
MIVTIDGPAGVGKTTITRTVARELGFLCLDSGALYRAIAWEALQQNLPLDDNEQIGELAKKSNIDFVYEDDAPTPSAVIINGHAVTQQIRTPEIDKAVTPVSQLKQVREVLLDKQRQIAATGNYIVEGRDTGTVVFPNADLKVFLTASPSERAHRRVRQNIDHCIGSMDYAEVLADINRRDAADTSREIAPLRPADDAIIVDTTCMRIQDVITLIISLIQDKQQQQQQTENTQE